MLADPFWAYASLPAIFIFVTFVIWMVLAVVAKRASVTTVSEANRSSSQERGSAGKTSPSADQSPQAVIAELRSALALREETIKNLRERGRRAVADRDRWEAEANRLQAEIAGLRTAATAAGRTDYGANKFRELKTALARMFHPDAHRSASNFERLAREELFKEINAEIDRIDGRRRDA